MSRLSLRPLLPLTLLLGAAAGCNDSDGPSLVGPGNGVSATVSRVIVQPKVDTIFARDSLLTTDAIQLQAAVVSFSGGLADGAKVRWSTPDTGIVTVDSTGVVRPRRLGTATVTASSGNKDDQATVVVAWAAQRLAITSPTRTANASGVLPTADTILVRNPVTVQDTRQLRARAIGVDGDTLTGVRYAWSSSNPTVATVDPTGLVRASGAVGTATITVRGADLTATRTVNVTSVVREVRVSAPAARVLTEDTLRLTARAIGYDSLPVSDARLAWTSSNPAVATIDSTGLARFALPGTVRFTATSHFTSGSTGAAPNAADVTAQERVFLSVDAGWDHTCGTITLGRVYCWGRAMEGQLGAAAAGDSVCFDTQPFPGTGNVACSLVPKRVSFDSAFAWVVAGDSTSCGVLAGGRSYCWGSGGLGRIGNGRVTGSSTPTLVTSAIAFDAEPGRFTVGGRHTCAITGATSASQTGQVMPRQVFCWGDDLFGQLGTQVVTVNSSTPIPSEVPNLPPMQWVSAGYRHTCALTTGGQAYCWGRNESGEIGTGSTGAPVQTPVAVAPGFTFSAISAGSIALAAAGVPLEPLRADSLAHTCALTRGGRAVCWGANDFGQIGNGTSGAPVPTPAIVAAPVAFSAISSGGGFTCALGADGQAYCWGRNDVAQLGAGSVGGASGAPVRVVNPGVSFVSISAGRRHACALGADGNAYCWGSEVMGAVGSELQARVQPRPTRVAKPL